MSTGLKNLLESVRSNATGMNTGRCYSSMAIAECGQMEYQQAFAECAFGYGDAIIERADIGVSLVDRLQNILESHGSDEIKVHEAFFGEGGFLDKIIKFIKKIFQKILDFIKKAIGFVFKNPETFKKRWRNIQGLILELKDKHFENDGSTVEVDQIKYTRLIKIIEVLINPKTYVGTATAVGSIDPVNADSVTNTTRIKDKLTALKDELAKDKDQRTLPSLADIIWLMDVSINGVRAWNEKTINDRATSANQGGRPPSEKVNAGGFNTGDWDAIKTFLDDIKNEVYASDDEMAVSTLKRILTDKKKNGSDFSIDEGITDDKHKIFKDSINSAMALAARIKEVTINSGTEKINHSRATALVNEIADAIKPFGEGDKLAEVLDKGVTAIDGDVRKLDILSSKLKTLGKEDTAKINADGSSGDNTTANKARETMNEIGKTGMKIANALNKAMTVGIDTATSLIVEMSKKVESTLTKISKTFKVRKVSQ